MIFRMFHYKRTKTKQNNNKKDKKTPKKTKKEKRSKPLIAVLEEVSISGIIFENDQRSSSV